MHRYVKFSVCGVECSVSSLWNAVLMILVYDSEYNGIIHVSFTL